MLQKMFPAMGTICSFVLDSNREEDLQISREIKEYVKALEGQLSIFQNGSETIRLMKSPAGKFNRVSEDLFRITEKSIEMYRLSDGYFDISMGALTMLWKKYSANNEIPPRQEILQALSCVGADTLRLDRTGRRIAVKKEGVLLDFGGIAKGYVLDQLNMRLRGREAYVCFGGSILSLGRAKTVDVQNPFAKTGESMGTLQIQDECVVTSGVNEQKNHIISPVTGEAVRSGLVSVTLVGSNASMLDALATAVMICGMEQGMELLRPHNIEAIFVQDTGEVLITEGLKQRFRFSRGGQHGTGCEAARN